MFLKIPGFQKADQWISKALSYPGIDQDALAQKKIYWIASLAVTSMIFCLTMACHLIFPQLRILIYYGLFFTLVFLQGVVNPIIFRRRIRKVTVWPLFFSPSTSGKELPPLPYTLFM